MRSLFRSTVCFCIRVAPMLILPLGSAATARADMLGVYGAGNTTSVSVSPGTVFQISIADSSYTDLYAWQFDLSWNPSVLALSGISEGNALVSAGSTYFIPGTIDNAVGVASGTADTLLGNIPGATGTSGTLAYFDFTALNAGVSTVDLSNVTLLDSALNTIPSSTSSAEVTVGGTAVTPEPGTFVLLVTGMIMALFCMRHKRRLLY